MFRFSIPSTGTWCGVDSFSCDGLRMTVTRRRDADLTLASRSAVLRVCGITKVVGRIPVDNGESGAPQNHFIASCDYTVVDPGLSNLTSLQCNFKRGKDVDGILDPRSYRIRCSLCLHTLCMTVWFLSRLFLLYT